MMIMALPAHSQKTKDIVDIARSGGGGGDGGGDGLWILLDAADIFIDVFIWTGGAITQGHRQILEKDGYIPRIKSLEFSGQYSAMPSDYGVAIPRMRANWGLFSTDIRYYHQFETRLGDFSSYNSFDWQFLMLNLVTSQKVNFRLGTGIMNERVTGFTYNENTFNLDIYPTNRLKINAEGRFALDYGSGNVVRREWNAGLYYLLAKHKRKGFHAFSNFMHARFYEQVDIWTLSGGISMTIE